MKSPPAQLGAGLHGIFLKGVGDKDSRVKGARSNAVWAISSFARFPFSPHLYFTPTDTYLSLEA